MSLTEVFKRGLKVIAMESQTVNIQNDMDMALFKETLNSHMMTKVNDPHTIFNISCWAPMEC